MFHTERDCAACHPLHFLYIVVTFFLHLDGECICSTATLLPRTLLTIKGTVDMCTRVRILTYAQGTCGPLDVHM